VNAVTATRFIGNVLRAAFATAVFVLPADGTVPVVSADSDQPARGNAEAGRSVFNGKGVCHYCHGVDGYRDKRPQLEADTAALIARLNPPPSDLRNPKSLRLKTDKARAKLIREGHEGTAMFPDTTMTDQELADTLAYLAVLRREGPRGAQR
jgi:mono/diheme cytochrome c family protein